MVIALTTSCKALWADPNVTKYIGGTPLSEEESWRYVGHWTLLGFGYWVAEEKAARNFVREIGFADHERGLEPSLKGVPEIGFVLVSQAHGRGYATEAVRAVVAWGDEHFPSARTACIIDPETLPSIRVAVMCGFKEFQLTTYREQPTTMFVREPIALNEELV